VNALTIRARSIARRIGLKKLYYKFVRPSDYEEHVRTALLSRLKPGDVVWDIGANRGHYTKIFCDKTGPTGRVFAFEPVPDTFAELCRNTAEYPWVHNEQLAFGNFDGVSRMVINPLYSVANHLQRDAAESDVANTVEVSVVRGDSFRAALGTTPNLIKIDVEGYEEEVLDGMPDLLSAPQLHVVLIEIHMEVLEKRGRALAPLRIEKLLQSKRLRTKWVDPGHICAERENA
jgi:FkbM family methyltransferase